MTNVSQDTFHLDEYIYGGFGIRGSKFWNEADTAFQNAADILTSEDKGREEGNNSSPIWTAIYGKIDGDYAGLAVLDHPNNFRHPSPVRLHPTMPYFSISPVVQGSFFLLSGDSYNTEFRIVAFDGEPDGEKLNALWEQFASKNK